MLFRDSPRENLIRWLAIVPVALIAAFLAFNFVTPFRLMQQGIWPADAGAGIRFLAIALDALLMLAPLMVVIVLAAWLTAPARKILVLRITASLLAGVAGVFAIVQVIAQHWHGAMVLAFGAVAAVATAYFVIRHERRQASVDAEGDAEAGEADAGAAPITGTDPAERSGEAGGRH